MTSFLTELIGLALKEDMPHGDITTDAMNCDKIPGKAKLVAKSDLVLSGCEAFERTFHTVDPQTQLKWVFKDGQSVSPGQEVCSITGPLASLLKAERTALNFMGRLSGVATLTARFVKAVEGTSTQITDTRKTTPGFRVLEKAAVLHGGGVNLRMSLSDAVLIKENHIRSAGSIAEAVKRIRSRNAEQFIQVEVTNSAEISEALEAHVDRILLDNMSLNEISEAVKQIGGRAIIEASGNMTLDRVKSVATLGVNFISVGSLTHSAPAADLSLLFEKEDKGKV